jgi:protein SCO1/2
MRYSVFLALLLAGCASRKPLPVLGEVPAFELTDQTGHPFTRARLEGHVWVADFIFTNCQGPCPRMSSHMRAMQNMTDPSFRLVSFTVDPDNDTPPVLETYGKRFGADDSRWALLTGSKETLNTLDQDAFKLGSIGAGLDHSTYFALVDKKGKIRGYYGIAQGEPAERIAKDAARLEKEPA